MTWNLYITIDNIWKKRSRGMKIKHFGIMMLVIAVIYALVEILTYDGGFNFFVPFALVLAGIAALKRKDREEKIFKKKES
jgi:hypothetical protein